MKINKEKQLGSCNKSTEVRIGPIILVDKYSE